MKKLILAISILFCTAATMTSCNNGDYDADPNTNYANISIPSNTGGGSRFDWNGTDPMSAGIEGVPFQATSGRITNGIGYIQISGLSGSSNDSIMFRIPDDAVAGNIIDLNQINVAQYTSSVREVYKLFPGSSSEVKIIELDAMHIKGLFYFSVQSSNKVLKNIYNGYFNINR